MRTDKKAATADASRRQLLGAGAAIASASLIPSTAFADKWPSKPIRFVCAQAPGASTDGTARSFADYMSTHLGVGITVENKPGGAGMIAAETVARSAPDGYTFLVTLHSQLAQAPVLLKKVPLDTSRDLVPIAALSTGVGVGVMKKDLPVANLKELVELARKRPITVGNYGMASGWHLMMLQLGRQTGAKFDIVNYKGTGPMLVDLLAGQIDLGGGRAGVEWPRRVVCRGLRDRAVLDGGAAPRLGRHQGIPGSGRRRQIVGSGLSRDPESWTLTVFRNGRQKSGVAGLPSEK